MKKILYFVSCLLLIQCNAGNGSSNSTNDDDNNSGTTVTITIPSGAAGTGSAAYGTNPLHVAVGTQVVWHNSDSMTHTATSDTSIWDTGDLSAGESSTAITFDTAGTYPYSCTIHGSISMSGEIIVP